jgi:hypothetical protein
MQLKKGILFTGCSYTWGGGLEWYAPYKIVDKLTTKFDVNKINYATYNFICKNRFTRLVADHFGTWDTTRHGNGGSDDMSINFINDAFNLNNSNMINFPYDNIEKIQTYNADEIEYVILQLTDPFRNNDIIVGDKSISLNIAKVRLREHQKDKNKISNFKGFISDEYFEVFYKFYSENFNSWDEMEAYFIKQNLELLKTTFKKLDELGIKNKVWSWHEEYIPYIFEDEYLSNKFMKLKYDNKEFNCLFELFKYNPKFQISKSDYTLNGKQIPDDHSTIECHRVIADSIISYIEND